MSPGIVNQHASLAVVYELVQKLTLSPGGAQGNGKKQKSSGAARAQ